MSQTIGTNVVVDGEEQYQLLKGLLDYLENMMNRRKEDLYAKNLRIMADHIKSGGQLSYTLVKKKFVPELEQRLQDEKIPYFPMPDENGDIAFMIRDVDRDRVFQIEHEIFSMSTDYWKEVRAEEMLEIVQHDKRLRREKIPVLSFQDDDMRLIASQKLYDNHMVSSYNGEAIIVHPQSLFGQSGDLVDLELDMAFEQAKRDGVRFHGESIDMLQIRKAQAKHDQEQTSAFIEAFQKREKGVALWDIYNNSSVGLKIDRNGDIVLMERQHNGKFTEERVIVTPDDDLSHTELFALISTYTEEIHDATKVTPDQLETVMNGRGEELIHADSKLARPKYKHLIERDEETHEVTKDIDYIKAELLFHGGENKFDTVLFHLKEEATRAVMAMPKYAVMSQTERAQAKAQYICDRIDDGDVPVLRSWLKETTDGYTMEDKQFFLDTIKKHLMDTHEQTTDEMTIDLLSAKQVKTDVLHIKEEEKTEENTQSKEEEAEEEEERTYE